MKKVNPVSLVTQNTRGAWVIYGLLGTKQYHNHTKQEAIKKYKKEYEQKTSENKKKGVLYSGKNC